MAVMSNPFMCCLSLLLLQMSARLASGQNQLYAALDKYKAAVAQLAGVTTSRVAVLSFLSDTPAASLVGRRLSSITPLEAAASSYSSSSRALQNAAGVSRGSSGPAWSWEVLPFDLDEDMSSAVAGDGSSGSSSRGLLAAAMSAAASVAVSAAGAAAGRLLLQSGSLEVYSRIATMGQSDADAIVARINNATRQAEFEKALSDAGLKLVPGSVAVKQAGQPPGGGWGLPGLNWNDPNQRRIIIIIAASVAAALVAVCLIWWATCCCKRRRGPSQAGLQQQFITGGRTPGSATPGSSGSSGLQPLFGAAAQPPVAGSNGRPLYNPFAGQPVPAVTYGPSAYGGAPGGRGATVPAGGYTVAGRTFGTAKEADDYALAMALSQSLQEQGSRQQPAGVGGFFGRYLPESNSSSSSVQPSQRQQDQQQLSAYPPIGFGHGFGGPAPYR
jgi:hypothetical protein